VGITRARRKLLLTRAHQRTIYNTPNFNAASRFLEEIPKRLTKDESALRDRAFRDMPQPPRMQRPAGIKTVLRPGDPLSIPGVQKGFAASPARAMAAQAKPQFKVGDRVIHRKFGEGTVTSISGQGMAARIRIDFIALGEKEFALSLAPIAKLEEET
jgi:DNA helicase-2/ATP-dependent DNA helicase PcrA